MGSKYIEIFLFFFIQIFAMNSQEISQVTKYYDIGRFEDLPCRDFYGLFVMDNSATGHETLSDQITIADYFFYSSSSLDYSSSITITSQSEHSVLNNFTVASPNDFASMNHQINEVKKQPFGGKTISYFNLVIQALSLDLTDLSIYPSNSFLVFFVNSQITDLSRTSALIKNLQIINRNKINVIGIAMSPQYVSQATILVGDFGKVYTYNSNDQNKFSNINNWILQQACSSPPFRTTTIKPTTTIKNLVPSKPCKSYINLVIQASSYGLTGAQYEKQINLIENYILPMWDDFRNFSTMLMYDSPSLPYRVYNNEETIDKIKNFIRSHGQSLFKCAQFYQALYHLNTYSPFVEHRDQMTTFVFLADTYDNEIIWSKEYVRNLVSHGKVNVIVMGDNINKSILDPLNLSNVTHWNYSDDQIKMIQDFFISNIKCL